MIFESNNMDLELRQTAPLTEDNLRESIIYLAFIIERGAHIAEPVVEKLLKNLASRFRTEPDIKDFRKTSVYKLYNKPIDKSKVPQIEIPIRRAAQKEILSKA